MIDGTGQVGREVLAQSPAFRAAELQSEVRRSYATLVVIGLVVLMILKGGASRDMDRELAFAAGVGAGALLAVQVSILAFARWARRRGRSIPDWFIVMTVLVEGLVPTWIMHYHIRSGMLTPYATLSGPPVLAYGLMITLTTLRMRPWLCVLAGAIGAGGYTALLLHVIYGLGIERPTTGLPRVAYINSALLVMIAGLAAAWVAYEIRRHVEAALGEAETKRKMGQIEQDLAVARSIQQALLPPAAPSIPGFEIAGWNRPADQTGGDYYDWQAMPDGNWIITLADVSGHGIGPAMVTAACRAYVRASSAHHGDLGSLASRINALLAEDLPDGRFITMVTVLIDPRGGDLMLLSAGHSPVVLYLRATGAMKDIPPHDLPLAVMPDQRFGPAQPIRMEPGDVLALVTDGFVEWSRPGADGKREQFGLERLRDSLRRHVGLEPGAMIRAVTEDVSAFAGSHRQQDDLTMVVIRRTG